MTAGDIDTVARFVPLPTKTRVLDVPCGDGSHARETPPRVLAEVSRLEGVFLAMTGAGSAAAAKP